MQMPDAIKVTGYKHLVVTGELELVSPSFGSFKWSNGWETAECYKQHSQPSPYELCHCGIYATKTLKEAENQLKLIRSKMSVVVVVNLAGKVIEYDRGYRAEFAKITKVALPLFDKSSQEQDIADFLGVPAEYIHDEKIEYKVFNVIVSSIEFLLDKAYSPEGSKNDIEDVKRYIEMLRIMSTKVSPTIYDKVIDRLNKYTEEIQHAEEQTFG